MNVSPINFKGMVVVSNRTILSKDKNRVVEKQDIFYHPFKDEAVYQAPKKASLLANKIPAGTTCWEGSTQRVLLNNIRIGKQLNFTEDAYKEVKKFLNSDDAVCCVPEDELVSTKDDVGSIECFDDIKDLTKEEADEIKASLKD